MSNQNVLILAPRSTIGQAVAERLVQDGAAIGFIGRDLSGVDADSAQFTEQCELSDFDALDAAVGRASEQLGGFTGLVNCAGSLFLKPAHQTNQEEFASVMEANVATAFAAVRAAARHFPAGGSVVLISSAAAQFGMMNHEAISAAKAAVEGLVRSAAATYASKAIRFNAVAPGLVESSLSEAVLSNDAARKLSESLHPLGRVGKPGDVASAICWLLHPGQSWVTGQIVGVDGGLSHVQPRPKLGIARR